MSQKKLPRKLDYATPPPARRQSGREWWWEQCKGLLALAGALAYGVVLMLSRRLALWLLAAFLVLVLCLLLTSLTSESRLRAGRSSWSRCDLALLYLIVLSICALVMTVRAAIKAP